MLLLADISSAQSLTCHFKVVVAESGDPVVEGSASVQNPFYRFETENGTLYCDGKTRWIYSKETQELVIQSNDAPVLNEDDFNNLVSKGSYSFDYSRYRIYLTSISQVQKPWPATFFIIDPESFDDETIITDLR